MFDGLLAHGDEAGHRLGADGEPDLLDRVEGQELGVELLALLVHRVEGHPVGVEEGEDLALDLDEDRVQGLGGVHAVDYMDEPLLVRQPLLQCENRFLDGHSFSLAKRPLAHVPFWACEDVALETGRSPSRPPDLA